MSAPINSSMQNQVGRFNPNLLTSHTKNSSSSKSRNSLPPVKVGKDGSVSGRVRPDASGKVSLPNGLSVQAPPAGGISTAKLSDSQLLVLTSNKDGTVSVDTKALGLVINEKESTVKGSVLPLTLGNQKVVDMPALGIMPIPEPGKTDSYMVADDKVLSLKSEADGTVSVNTRTLGLEADKKGNFKGALLPDPATGKIDIGGKELDVSGMKPGETKTKTVKVNGKKYKVKLKMNADGTVSVEGKRKKGLFSKVAGFIGKALSVVGKFAPFLAAIPGLGWAALVAKGVSLFNAAKGVFDGIKSGNWLGALGSAASLVAGAFKGAVSAVANTVSQVTNLAQTALNTFTYGLGKGVLQIVSNGANLLSSAAGVLGLSRLSEDAGKVSAYAGAVDQAAQGNLLPGAALLANSWGADLVRAARTPKDPNKDLFYTGVKFNTSPTLADFGGPEALAQYDALMLGMGMGGSSSNPAPQDSTRSPLPSLVPPGPVLVAGKNGAGLGGAISNMKNFARGLLNQGEDLKRQGEQFWQTYVNNGGKFAAYDGMFLGANGFSTGSNVPTIQPTTRAPNGATVLYVNGIDTSPDLARYNMQKYADQTGASVKAIYNSTHGAVSDVFGQSAADWLGISNNPATKQLEQTIYQTITRQGAAGNMHLVLESQGAIIGSTALARVRDRLLEKYPSATVDAMMGKIKVETYGGAAPAYPDGPKYVHIVRPGDPVAQAFGMSVLTPMSYAGRDAVVVELPNTGRGALANHLFREYVPNRPADPFNTLWPKYKGEYIKLN
jgi:hypothetical protein